MCDYVFVGRDAELRKDQPFMSHVIDHVGVVVGIDGTYPLIHTRPRADVLRCQSRPPEGFIDVRSDGASLVDHEIAVPEDRNAVERMQRQVFGLAHHRLKVVKLIRYVLMRQNQTDNVDIRASWKAVDNWISHLLLLSRFLVPIFFSPRM